MKKKWIKWIVVLAVIAILAVVAVIVLGKGYRVIKVEDFDGEVSLERGSDEKDIFEGMKLKSEDTLTTEEDGLLELLVDSDKHILAKENTCFTIQSTGNKKKGKLTIELEYGTSLVEIENKLPDGYDVEVETPNASLSVRGTTFEVSYDEKTNTTVVEVTEGKVKVESANESIVVEAGSKAVVIDEEINLDDTFLYQDKAVFEIISIIGDEGTGIYAKQLVDWQYGCASGEGYLINEFFKDGVSIRYSMCTEDEVNYQIDMDSETGCISELNYLKNGDGDTIIVVECDYQGERGNINRAFYYFKEFEENKYLSLFVFDQDAGKSLGDATNLTYLDLTMDCYYMYGLGVPVEPGASESSGNAAVNGNEATESTDTTAPAYKVYLMNDDFPDLIKGGSSYDQMRYMIKIALVSDMNGHSDYLKEALFLMCHEGYQTDVFPPIEGTENVYDIDMLNNMFSFLTDEKIAEEHLNVGSTISGNRLTTYEDYEQFHELTAIGLASMYYGENDEIIIEFIAEKHTIVNGMSGDILQYKGTAYLAQDETGKYVFDYLEWEER